MRQACRLVQHMYIGVYIALPHILINYMAMLHVCIDYIGYTAME